MLQDICKQLPKYIKLKESHLTSIEPMIFVTGRCRFLLLEVTKKDLGRTNTNVKFSLSSHERVKWCTLL